MEYVCVCYLLYIIVCLKWCNQKKVPSSGHLKKKISVPSESYERMPRLASENSTNQAWLPKPGREVLRSLENALSTKKNVENLRNIWKEISTGILESRCFICDVLRRPFRRAASQIAHSKVKSACSWAHGDWEGHCCQQSKTFLRFLRTSCAYIVYTNECVDAPISVRLDVTCIYLY